MNEQLDANLPTGEDRRPYEPPRLSHYGDLAELTESLGPFIADQEIGGSLLPD